MTHRTSTLRAISALLFTTAGLVWVISGHVVIGMMNVAVAMMFVVLSLNGQG